MKEGIVKRVPFIVAFLMTTVVFLSVAAAADEGFNAVKARNFDPFHTRLVNASWVGGIGCPTNAKIVAFDPTGTFLLPPSTYTDPACGTGDTRDKTNEGLLMAKTGPTNNDAAAVADLVGVKGFVLTELGYDIRKPGTDVSDPRGSHCGAGAPRFDITLADGEFFFLGCNSPAATTQTPGTSWIRLRWGGSGGPLQAYLNGNVLETIPAIAVKSISIVFDEGQDTAPDNFGLAVLDNIDVNGTLVGKSGGGGGDDSGDLSGKGGDGGGGSQIGGGSPQGN
jgi:hypothetical protein